MKLFIRRDESESRMNKGLALSLSSRAERTPEGKAIITKHRAENYGLVPIIDQNSAPIVNTVSSLINSGARTADDISILFKGEDVLKKTCESFKTILGIMSSFSARMQLNFGKLEGGERNVDIKVWG